eukprot:g14232.t1
MMPLSADGKVPLSLVPSVGLFFRVVALNTLGTLPGYCGLVDRHKLLGFEIEAWPQFRIGGSLWPSGALLGKWLLENKDLFLYHFGGDDTQPKRGGRSSSTSSSAYLELGAGVGLPSLVVAREFKPKLVTVTDYADLMPLMQRNLELNFGIGSGASCDKNPATSTSTDIKERKQEPGVIEVEEDNSAAARIIEARALDWAGCGADKYPTRRGYDVLLGADIVYAEEQDPLVNVLEGFFLNEAPREELQLPGVDEKGGQERGMGKSSLPLEDFFRAVRERIEGKDSNEGSVGGVVEDGAGLSPEEIEVQEKIEEHDQEMLRVE